MNERKYVAWLRSVVGMSQEELALAAGISPSYVQKLEAGKKMLSGDIARQLAVAACPDGDLRVDLRAVYGRIVAMRGGVGA